MFSKKASKAPAKNRAWSEVRRCHKCGSVHESQGERVFKCSDCGANFAPFFYAEYTPESLALGQVESLVLSDPKKYRPLVGFTWWWNDSANSGESIMPRA